MHPTLHIHLLGDFLLVSGDTPVTTVNVPRLQSLLAYLVLHRTAPQARSRLAFLLWPDSTEAQAHTNLRKALYQLRQAVPDIDHLLYTDKHSLQWRPQEPDTPWTLDVLDVEQAFAQATQAEQEQNATGMRRALEQVIRLYRGDLLPGCYDEWILPERDRIRQLFLQAAERLIALLEQERDYDAAIRVAQRLLHHDPLHETTYRTLMRLHALRGDQTAALRVYHTCVTALERELTTEPSKATRELYESLLRSDTSTQPVIGPLTPGGRAAPLIGRKNEWWQLQAAWRKAVSGRPHMVILAGEAGIGKTRLAEEMATWVSRQGLTTLSARCYAAEGRLAYAPITTWLRSEALQTALLALAPVWLTEVARLLPELRAKRPDLPRPTSLAEEWQRQRFFEALAHALLSAPQPLLLLLDDLQWCDNETLAWLHYLLRFAPQARLLFIGTVRSEEALPEHSLISFLSTLQRSNMVTELTLEPLNSAETIALAEKVAGQTLDAAMLDTLYHETEGNPLFVVEMIRAGALGKNERKQSSARSSLLTQPASTLPSTVQTVLSTRLAQLSPFARELASVAAVIGREFSSAVLLHVTQESEEAVVRGLDELWQRRIVREQGEGAFDTYDFSHDKLREQAYTSLSPAHRRLLHRRVAESLQAVYAGDLDAAGGQIAAHYERAGLPAQAIPYYQRAGEAAIRIYANAEAISAFQRAAALLEESVSTSRQQQIPWETAAQVHMSLGNTLEEVGRYEEARQVYQRAMASLPPQEFLWQARLLRKMARLWNSSSDNPLDAFHLNARQTFQEAERALEQVDNKTCTEWRQEWIQLQIDRLFPIRGSVEEMTAIIEKARTTVEHYGTAEQRAYFLLAMVACDSTRDRYQTAEAIIPALRETLATFQHTGNKGMIAFAHFALGVHLLWAGELDEAEEHLSITLHMGERGGSAVLQTRSLTFLPFVFRRRGQVERARDILIRAQAGSEARENIILTGHRAWVAWRDGKLAEAEAYGRASLGENQAQNVNIFRWAGIWPLIGVALTQEKVADAMDYTRMLLDPTQQPPPKELRTLLEATLQAWDAGQPEEARTRLQRAVPLAEQMGYL